MATIVRKQPGESDDRLIARFRKKVLAEEIIEEIKEKEYHKPDSLKKKERLAVIRRLRRR